MKNYDHKKIEKKWQEVWEKDQTYRTSEDPAKPKSYVLDMFPYPSGEGLHTGHVRVYTASDVYARMKRMQGYRVLHPTGWDAFGLPAEQFAIKNKIHPKVAVEQNVNNFRRQMRLIGLSYDWNREIDTTDPAFYKWTQWIFLKLYEKGLAYESYEPINWCPSCQTGLANEDLDGNQCERCGTVVEKRPMRQWVLKITDYADRLINDLDLLQEWPLAFREAQKNWIGRSEGAEIEFAVDGSNEKIKVFTTRADTLFGATYVVLAPEHTFVTDNLQLTTNKEEVLDYIKKSSNKTEIERSAEGKEKTGVELKGVRAINPANKEEIPIFIADYVLAHYGTGAIMAVPAHDTRDYEFAEKFGLPIKNVIEPLFVQDKEPGAVRGNEPFVEREAITAIVKHWSEDKYIGLKWKKVDWDTLITGGVERGQTPEEAAMAEIREETGFQNIKLVKTLTPTHAKFFHVPKNQNRFAHFHVMYFELTDGEKDGVSPEEQDNHEVVWLTEEEMGQFRLPESHRFSWRNLMEGKVIYTGSGIVANSDKFTGMDNEEAKAKITEFVGGKMKTTYKLRDWVFSRQRYWGEPIPIIHCGKCGIVPVPEKELPVTLPEVQSYEPAGTGESPLADIPEWVNTKCPKCGGAGERETNTMPQWAGSSWYYLRFIDPHNESSLVDGKMEKDWMPVDVYVGGAEHATRHLIYARFWHKFLKDIGIVSTDEPFTRLESVGLILGEGGVKMSKRLGNVVNPDEAVGNYGADTLRLYEMFIGPFSQASAWNNKSIIGPRRFLERVWKLTEKIGGAKLSHQAESVFHRTVKKVGEDITQFKFNTAISQMMILVSCFEKEEKIPDKVFADFLKLLAPFAPHIAEELWEGLGQKTSVHLGEWPVYDESKLSGETETIVIQINGKVRGSFIVEFGTPEEGVKREALGHEITQKWLAGKEPKKVVYVPGKLVSIVA